MQHVRNVFLFAVLGLLGCEHVNSNYCGDAPHTNCKDLVDAPIDGPPTGCKATPAICTGATPACDMVADTCVECTTTSKDLCIGVEPVCGSEKTCRGCTAHSECASEVCLPDGSCAVEGDVAYVDGTSGAGVTCTKNAPCKTVTLAIATPKALVKVTGAVDDRVSIGRAVKLFAAPNAELSSTSNGTLLTTTGAATVEVYDLTIANASGVNVGYGVQVSANTTFAMTRGNITGCREAGLITNGGTVTVTGSTVTGNTGGGISITNSTFKLVNNFIASNGNGAVNGSGFGGVQMSSSATTNEFTQNTVVFNHQTAIALNSPGVNCSVSNFAGARNIISGNDTGTVFGAQTAGACTFPDSFVNAGSAANTLGFANVNTLDFHLTAASPATVRDVPGLTNCPGNDIDRDARPFNALCDLGADEYKP